METIHRDYADKGVNVYFIYKTLAHPEGGRKSYVEPYSLEERLAHVKEAKRTLGSTIPWLCDNMKNELKNALGGANNSEIIFGPNGKIVKLRDWSNPTQLRKDLEGLVGPVDNPTRVADLDLKIETTPRPAARGVVRKLQVPSSTQAVKLEPKAAGLNPYYAKLRAEADSSLLSEGNGKLYLGFHLDPLYDVHWNNLAAPVTYEIEAPQGVIVTPAKGEGPKIKEEADVDPREFLIDIKGADADKPLQLTVKYFACNDDEGWCKPVTQEYVIHLKRDRDAGVVFARSRSRGR